MRFSGVCQRCLGPNHVVTFTTNCQRTMYATLTYRITQVICLEIPSSLRYSRSNPRMSPSSCRYSPQLGPCLISLSLGMHSSRVARTIISSRAIQTSSSTSETNFASSQLEPTFTRWNDMLTCCKHRGPQALRDQHRTVAISLLASDVRRGLPFEHVIGWLAP